jgi:threonine/homoserine/homoserine lactone efflux protein
MEFYQLLSFSIATFFMAVMPGPDNIYVITESVSKGSKNGILISLGLNLGVLIHTIAAATGISIILAKSEFAFQLIQYLGAAYIFYMAYGAYKENAIELNKPNHIVESKLKILRTGFLMNVLNPKVSLFFIAFLPQFVNTELELDTSLQMIVFGFLFMIIGFITFSSFALLAAQLRKSLSKPSFWIAIKWLKVCVLFFLGGFLLFN